MEFLERYLAWQKSQAPDLHGLRFVVDCSNGMASLFAHQMFPQAKLVNATMDGNFPCHSPNPLRAEAREQLSSAVREGGFDCGVIFDGDADRAMFVDERGEFVQPDYLIPVIAQSFLHDTYYLQMPPKVVHDVRTSRGAIETLRELGCEPLMVPVGHAFAKPVLRSSGAICGGELAGHYYFRDFFCCDSGLLAALKVLGEIADAKACGETFSQMMRPIVSRYANSGELNYKVEDKDAAIARMLKAAKEQLPEEVSRSTIDGYRLEYASGWVSIRKSNTEPYLRLLVEAKTDEEMRAWIAVMETAINDD